MDVANDGERRGEAEHIWLIYEQFPDLFANPFDCVLGYRLALVELLYAGV